MMFSQFIIKSSCLTIAMHENASSPSDCRINKFLGTRYGLSRKHKWRIVQKDLRGEEANEILFFVVLHVKGQICEVILKTRSNWEGLFHIPDANTLRTVSPCRVTWGMPVRYMWVIASPRRTSNDLDATKGPSNKPGRTSWHSLRISYLSIRIKYLSWSWMISDIQTSIRRPLGLGWQISIPPRLSVSPLQNWNWEMWTKEGRIASSWLLRMRLTYKCLMKWQ